MQRALMNTQYLQSKITHLHSLHNRTVTEYGELVESLNDECETLCEIIPSYKISATLDQEGGNDGTKKKEVFTVQKLEHEMLTQYERFLQMLRKLSKRTHPEQQALGSRLTAKLVAVASEFNHADRLLLLAVDYANCKVSRVAQPCQEALAELLDGQMITEATDHIVGAILGIVRKQSYAVNPKILNILLHLRVAMVDMHRRDLTEEKAKEKRMKKEDKELARQMQKAKARRDRAEVAAKQTTIIHRLFVVYLRILEAAKSCSKQHQARILAPCLEGLVKFAPLVNVELFHLLMKALRELLDMEDTAVSTKLHGLIAVASLAQKDAMQDASEWRVDLAHFHEILFQCLPEALNCPVYDEANAKKAAEGADEGDVSDTASQGSTSTSGSLSSNAFSIAQSMAQARFVQSTTIREWTYRARLVLRAVDLLILSQKHLPAHRVLAFCRRLHQFLPVVPAHIALSMTTLCHRLYLRHPTANAVIIGGADNGVGGRGAFNPEAETTSSSHSDCSFAWELSLLRKSFHPTVSKVSESMSKHYLAVAQYRPGQEPPVSKQLNALGPYEVLEAYDCSVGDIVPAPSLPTSLKVAAKRAREDEN